MTILIGAIVGERAFIGADSLITWDDNFVRDSKMSKFVELPTSDVLIATSGQDRFTQILEDILESEENSDILDIKSRQDVRRLAKLLYKEVDKYGVGEADNNQLPDHEFGFLLVSKQTNRIWSIESDYSVQEYDDYVCTGAGGFLGESAMRALGKARIFGKEAIYTAIETVSELHPYCGGRIEIRDIKLENGD
jgi:ATP-dependent protease HslVU (ClpYQ) peptidase subunit